MKVELGSGYYIRKGWISCDQYLPTKVFADGTISLQWSAPHELPFNDHEINFIYTSHFLEHLHWEDAFFVLKECRRILKPSGSIRICLPDAQPVISSYLSRDPNLLSIAEDDQRHDVYSGLRPHIGKNDPHKLLDVSDTYKSNHRLGNNIADLSEVYSKRVNPTPGIFSHIDAISYFLLADGHKQLYDFQKLSTQLSSAGFSSISQSEFDSTYDHPDRRSSSFYAVAT